MTTQLAQVTQELHSLQESCQEIILLCRQKLGPMLSTIFDFLIESIDCQVTEHRNDEFQNEIQKQRFFNQRQFQIYDKYKGLVGMQQDLKIRISDI